MGTLPVRGKPAIFGARPGRVQETMTPLEELLARRIRAQGPLTVAEFVAEALGHPEYGYYATRDPLGRRGDFTTAPEISQIFGELIGLWGLHLSDPLGPPPPFSPAQP